MSVYRQECDDCTQSDWHRSYGVWGKLINKQSDLHNVSEVNWRLFLTSLVLLGC